MEQPSTEQLSAFAHAILKQQPFAVKLGTRLDAFSSGHAELSLPIVDDLRQQHGFVHGGVLSYLSDNALTFAGGSVLGDALTVEFKINYLRPARGQGRLVAVADVIGQSKSQAVVRCDVFVESVEGTRFHCAAAQGTIVKALSAAKSADPADAALRTTG